MKRVKILAIINVDKSKGTLLARTTKEA